MSQWLEAVNVTQAKLEDAQAACRKRLEEVVRKNRPYVARIAQKFKSFEWQPEQLIAAGLEGFKVGLIEDRKSGVSGKSGSVRVDLGGRRIIKKTNRRKISNIAKMKINTR